MATDPWGIEERFHDAFGGEHVTSDETRAEVLRAMGINPQEAPPAPDARPPVRVVRPGDRLTLGAGELHLEGGGSPLAMAGQGEGEAPPPLDLPLGYHTFVPAGRGADGQRPVLVVAAPAACYLPADLRTWGFAVQLYATRSRASWGMGDLADLRALGAYVREQGGGVMMVNPLSAPTPVAPIEPSPYYPSSRRFRNPLYLRIEEVPGAAELGPELDGLAQAGRALGGERKLDRDRVFALKMQALERLWAGAAGQAGERRFDDYRREQGAALDLFAAHAVLCERHGKDWRRWPEELRHPACPAVARLIAEEPRVRFHAWVQALLDEQLGLASAEVKIIHDLPIGIDVAGADAWCWQDLLAHDISVGCPPDEFNAGGQDWGLTPFAPAKMRAAGYAPFIETIRAALRHAGGLRIDHVMGLFRLFWIPRRLGPKGGTYVRYPADDLLAIVALESQRARAFIVGEDLGTVEPGTRETMAAMSMLSYRLLYFEPGPPAEFPELALSSVTTHDLATIAGLWSGVAVDHARGAGVTANEQGMFALRDKLAALSGVPAGQPVAEAIVETHRALARAPSRIVLGTLEDALAVSEQPNMPGTVTSWPNWSLALPWTVEEIRQAELPRRIAAAMRRA
jgi:4-alpha-glucanotransferase